MDTFVAILFVNNINITIFVHSVTNTDLLQVL